MVEIQTNSKFRSLILSLTRSPGPPYIQIDAQMNTTSNLDVLNMNGKIRTYDF
jgi:hypothetical protein